VRQRVLAYVTRQRDGAKELLVFDHQDDPDAGTQVPAGRLDPGETLAQCLVRELHAIVATIVTGTGLHPDFGSGNWDGVRSGSHDASPRRRRRSRSRLTTL
jgi:hypothetical protein